MMENKEEKDEKEEKELLCFSGNGITCAVEFSEVVEICTNIPVERIPCLPRYFCGISHYKGVLVSIVEINETEETEETGHSDVVVLVDSGDYVFGIRIAGEPWLCPGGSERIENISESLLPGLWKEKAIYRVGSELICQLDLKRSADGLALNK